MKFILAAPGNWYDSWKQSEQAIALADELGFWGAVIADHYMWMQGWGKTNKDSTVESWIALSYLAAKTKQIKLGTLVTPIPFRPPAMLAKMVATVDVLSHGRALLGVGAGWSQTEFDGYSHWDDSKTRVSKTEEGLELILQLWQKPKVDFEGKFYKSKGAILDPKPIQVPRPPLLFGGVGPKMLEMAGRHGDLVYIPPWGGKTMEQSKTIVMEGARKIGREAKIKFVAGSISPREEFDLIAIEKDVARAQKSGAEYYLISFEDSGFLDKIKKFGNTLIKKG